MVLNKGLLKYSCLAFHCMPSCVHLSTFLYSPLYPLTDYETRSVFSKLCYQCMMCYTSAKYLCTVWCSVHFKSITRKYNRDFVKSRTSHNYTTTTITTTQLTFVSCDRVMPHTGNIQKTQPGHISEPSHLGLIIAHQADYQLKLNRSPASC